MRKAINPLVQDHESDTLTHVLAVLEWLADVECKPSDFEPTETTQLGRQLVMATVREALLYARHQIDKRDKPVKLRAVKADEPKAAA